MIKEDFLKRGIQVITYSGGFRKYGVVIGAAGTKFYFKVLKAMINLVLWVNILMSL